MKAIIMIGVPGSGKSTIASQFAAEGMTVLSADKIREQIYGDAAIQGEPERVWGQFYRELEVLIAARTEIVIDNTNVRSKDRKVLLEYLIPAGYYVEYWLIDTPVEKCLQRNSQRERKVPESVILKMASTLQLNKLVLRTECDNIRTINWMENNERANGEHLGLLGGSS